MRPHTKLQVDRHRDYDMKEYDIVYHIECTHQHIKLQVDRKYGLYIESIGDRSVGTPCSGIWCVWVSTGSLTDYDIECSLSMIHTHNNEWTLIHNTYTS